MAKANMVGVSGAALSLVSAGTLSFVALATYSMGTSLTSDFNNDMHDVMGRLALVYTAGAIIGLLSQLGASLQLPSLVIGLPFAWYFNHPVLYVIYFVGLLGKSLLILSMFVEYSLADKGLKAPPFSRIRTWTLGEAGSGARPLPKRVDHSDSGCALCMPDSDCRVHGICMEE